MVPGGRRGCPVSYEGRDGRPQAGNPTEATSFPVTSPATSGDRRRGRETIGLSSDTERGRRVCRPPTHLVSPTPRSTCPTPTALNSS